MEKNFDSRALLAGTYDFVTCQRSDGSYYGNGGTQCKKGSESSLPQKESTTKLSSKLSATIDKYAIGIQKMNANQTIDQIKDTTAQLDTETKRIREKIDSGKLTFEEYEDFLINGHNNIAGSQFVIRGMEPGGNKTTDNERLDLLAQDIAVSKIERQKGTDIRVTELIREQTLNESGGSLSGFSRSAIKDSIAKEDTDGWKYGGSFVNKVRTLAEEADPSRKELISPAAVYMSSSVKTVDYLPMRGTSIQDTSMYKALNNSASGKADPRFQGVSKRADVIAKYGAKRDEVFMDNLRTAATTNPKFRGGFAAPGGGNSKEDLAKWNSYKQLAEKHQAKGGKVYSYTYNGKDSKAAPATGKGGQNVDVLVYDLGKGKHFVAARTSVNASAWNKNSMKDIFVTAEGKAKRGELSEWKGKAAPATKAKGSSTRTKKAKVEEPRPKKTSGGMSTWSKSKLERARQRAYDQGNDAQVAKINAILGGMS